MPYIDQFLQANPEFANKDENALAEALYNAHFKDEGTLDEFKAEFLGSKESTLQDIGAAAGTAPIKLAQVVAGIPAGVSDAVTWAANKAANGLGLAPPNYTGRDNPIVAGSRALSDGLGKFADAVGEELHTDEFNRKAKAEAARSDKGTIGGLWGAATSGDMDLLKKQANANWEDVKDAAAFYGNNPLHGFAAGVESAPMMLAPMAAAKMAGGAGLSATKAAIATGAAMEGASAASGTRMRIDDMSVDDLSLVSPEFNNLLMQGMAPETAKSELARLAGGEAFTISAIASGIASKLTGAGKFEADVGAGGVGGVFKGGLRGGATEFPQEFIESGAGQYAENQAIKNFANSEQNLSKGVLKAATQGGIVGMGTGATVGAARGLFSGNAVTNEQSDTRPDVTGKDGTDLIGNQGNSPVIDDHLKRTQDELKAFEKQEKDAIDAGLAQAVQNAQAASAQNQQAVAQQPAAVMPQDPELQAMAAQGVPVVEITPPVQEQPQPKTKSEPVTPFDEVAEDVATPEQNGFKGLPIQELPVDKLTLSNDVPQFKDGAGKDGVVEPLGGKFDRTGVAPIQVWQRNDGRMEVISGRHRLDLARRSGESTIPVQVHREADGFDAIKASTLDAELNIRDGQGKVADYVQYFTKSNIDKQEAIDRGLLSRAIGKRSYAIATQGDSELIAAHRANVTTDLGAYTIATAFPNDGKRQQVALARLQQGDNVEKAVNVARALSAITGGDSNFDMFGFDDSAIKEAERMAKEATAIQRQISTDIAAVQGAAKNPKAAAKFGVNVSDPDGVKKRIESLKEERAQWDNWHTNPALVAQLRGEEVQAAEPIAQAQPSTAQDGFLTSYDESTIQSQEANAKTLAQQESAQKNKEAIDAGVDNFSLDMGNVPDDDGGATFDMFSAPEPVAQPKPTQAPVITETVAPTYDTITDTQEIVPSKSGEPFKTIAAAKLSATFKNTPNAEIKQIGDKQFVVVKGKAVNESTSSTQEQLKNDFQDYPVKIMESIIENGHESMLYKFAGVKNGYAFSNLSIEDQATAYANFVSSGGKSVTGLPTDYNKYVMDEENKIKQRQLQSLHSVQQENGKPFKTEASAKQYQEKYNLRKTHDVVSVGKGFELKKVSIAEQFERERIAAGGLTYGAAQSIVAKEMGLKSDEYGEYDATDEQFDEMDRRIDALMRGEYGGSDMQVMKKDGTFMSTSADDVAKISEASKEQAQPRFETDIKQANQASYEQIKSEMLNNGWEVEGDKLKKIIQTDNEGELSDGSRIVYASHKNGTVQLEHGFNSQQVPFNTYNNDPVKTIAVVERRMTKLVPDAKQDKNATASKADKPKSNEQAEAEAMIAEGLDELMSLLGGKMNLTPEQESQIIPIMAKLFRGFAKLGYIKFKDAAAKVYETIESKLGKEIADQISIDNLQAGYINIASEIGGNKKDALMIESIDELRNSEETNNVNANDASNILEQDSQDAKTQNAVGKKRVQAESGRDGRSDGQRDQGSGSQLSSNDVGSSAGVAGYEAPVAGERGNIEVYTGSNARTETSSTRSDVDSGSRNDSYDGVPIEPVGTTTPATATTSLGERVLIREQQKKLSKGGQTDGIESIREDLPFLLPPQQDDVAKAESIYQEHTGYGMLFTNGTGTGKTFTGLGIVKRFANRGKTNTLIIAPSEQIIKQWVDAARDFFALTVNQLENTVSSGKGIVITTYANLTANNELAKRDWDLVVADEAQRLLMNESGETTGAIKNFRAITNHKRGAITRTEMLHHELYAELKQVQSDLKGAKAFDNDAYLPEIARLEVKQNKLLEQIQAKRAEVDTQVAATQGEKRSRALFLSATPFAYEKTIDWAEGYLFDYAEGSSKESDGQAYNSGNTKDQFFMRHFGYRMRFNKLTEPDVGVDRGLMQRQFNTWLKKKGVLSGRMLEVDADYDRKFVLVNSGIGTRIDEALRWLSDKSRSGNTAASELSKELNDKFDYLSRQYLLEAIKAKEVIAHIKEHLTLGRKVVVFHDFIKGGGVNPFKLGEYSGDHERESLLREFDSEFRDLINSSAFNASSPIETLSEAFPDLLLFNGRVPKNVRKDNVTKFQDDASGPQVILVQSAAGKEGISLHDTTGKYQRALFNLGQPTQPTTAIQQEGRIYRTGQKSDAIIRYLNTGTNWEKFAFATKIAERASASENLGMGELARALKDAFISAFDQSDDYRAGMENEGKGGKELDKAANNALTEYDRARAFYFANQKKTSKNKAAEGVDYFATPEPVGLKMVEMADIRIGESALEPSAGHGAIARWMPSYAKVKAIEPSLELQSRLAMNVSADSIIGSTFEAFNVVNKFDAIVMNPPFGVGGKTAIEHLDKASKHLRNGGRIVAIIPSGPAADKRLNAWLYGNDKEEGAKDFYLVADVLLPTRTFERAGTQVATHIVVLEKQKDKAKVENIRQHGVIDYRSADSVKDLFDRMEFLSINPRAVESEKPTDYKEATQVTTITQNDSLDANNGELVEHTTKAGKVIRGVVRTDLTQAQAKKIDEFTFKKDGGYFIREKHLASLANMDAGVKFSFAGQRAKTANLENLATAQQALADGMSRDEVRQRTGWHQDEADKQWKWEIDDSGAKLKIAVLNADEVNEHQAKIDNLKNALDGIMARDDLTSVEKQRAKSNADARLKMLESTAPIKRVEKALTKRVRTVAELLDHSDLLTAYPSVGDIKIAYSDDGIGRKSEKGEYGSYNPETNEIRLNVNIGEKEILSTLMHEIQHAIQQEENFARGGGVEDGGYEAYRSLAGETEARNTQKRLTMDAQARKLTAPWKTQDVPSGKQIVRFDGGRAEFAPKPVTLTKQSATDIVNKNSNGKRLLDRKKLKVLGSIDEAPEYVLEQAKRSEVASDTIMVDGVERSTRNSNGQLIHPTKQGIENFWRWFGDSKVVDDDGKPLVVYHYTPNDIFEEFDRDRIGETNRNTVLDGFFFADKQFPSSSWNKLETYLKIENAYDIDVRNSDFDTVGAQEAIMHYRQNGTEDYLREYFSEYERYDDEEIIDKFSELENADGAILRNVGYDVHDNEFIVFEPNQIKSAIGNNGDFDPENKNILYSQDGKIQGFFDPATDTTYLVADALTKDTIMGVLTHEVGGHAWWRNADKAIREALGNRAAKLIEHGIEFGNERLKAFYNGVQSRLVEAKVLGNNEEAFAYLAEEAINEAKAWRYALSDSRFIDAIAKVSKQLANLISDAIAYLKSSMHRLGWLDTNKLTGADLVAIAKRNMREVATSKGVENTQSNVSDYAGVLASMASDKPTQAEIAQAQRDTEAQKASPATPSGKTKPKQTAPSNTGKSYEAKIGDDVRIDYQDDMLAFKRVQETLEKKTGKKVPDVYESVFAFKNKAAAGVDAINAKVNKALEAMSKLGVTPDVMGLYLYAKGAKDRNAMIEKRQIAALDAQQLDETYQAQIPLADIQTKYDALRGKVNKNGSGMGDARADQLLADLQQTYPDIDSLTAAWYDIIDGSVLRAEQTGLLTDGWLNENRKAQPFYVPMKHDIKEGSELTAIEEQTGVRPMIDFSQGIGKAFNLTGREIKKANGRISEAGDILTHIVADAQRLTIRAEKNVVGSTLAKLAIQHKDDKLWVVQKEVPSNEGKGVKDGYVGVKVKGNQYYIVMRDERLAKAAAGINSQDFMWLDHLNQFIKKSITAWNPVFTIVNSARDTETAYINATGVLGSKGANKMIAYGKGAMKAIWEFERNSEFENPNSEWSQWMQLYLDAGGKTGFRDFRSIIEVKENLDNQFDKTLGVMERIQRGVTAKEKAGDLLKIGMNGIKNTAKWLEDLGAVSENVWRVAAFRVAIEQGKSAQEAAKIARELTVNFNRKGHNARGVERLFLFYNAAIQGTHNLASRAAKDPLYFFGKVGGSLLLLGVTAAMMGGGDDSDEWANIPEEMKMRGIPFHVAGQRFVIPMAYGFGLIPYAGMKMVEMAKYEQSKGKYGVSVEQGMRQLVNATMLHFNPFGGQQMTDAISGEGSSALQWITPTVGDPLVQIYENTNVFGKRLHPEGFNQDDTRPDSEKVFDHQRGTWYDNLAKGLNTATGGNSVEAGVVSVAPSSIKAWADLLAGGWGREIGRVITLAGKSFDDTETIKAADIPVLSVVWKQPTDADIYHRYSESTKAINEVKSTMTNYIKAGDTADAVERKKFMSAHKEQLSLLLTPTAKDDVSKYLYTNGFNGNQFNAAYYLMVKAHDDKKDELKRATSLALTATGDAKMKAVAERDRLRSELASQRKFIVESIRNAQYLDSNNNNKTN